MEVRAFDPRGLEPIKSVFGGALNMLWLVDAVELAVRCRSLNPLRMWLYFKTRPRED